MAQQQQKAGKQPQDPFAKRGKTLTSSVQRLRGWVGSDPSRVVELADALVEVTEHRLLGHAYAAAAADAQDSARRAAQLLTASGPIGPYTSVADATRYLTAVVHVATVQVGLGLPDAAGRTMESLQPMQQQLEEMRLEVPVSSTAAVWALSALARGALATGDVALANAYADGASARLAGATPVEDGDAGYLAVDVLRLASDCRWAAGHSTDALGFLHEARDRYEVVVGGRLDVPARLSPALLERLTEPLFGIYRDLADRLVGSGELDLGLATRRVLVERLQKLSASPGDVARLQLASALADLAADLLTADRVDEAGEAAAQADDVALDWAAHPTTRLLVADVHARVLTRTGRAGTAVARLRQVLQTVPDDSSAAARGLAWTALAEALRGEGDLDAAVAAEQTARELTADLGAPADAAAATGQLRDEARRVLGLPSTPSSWSPLPSSEWFVTSTSAPGAERPQSATAEQAQPESEAWLEAERAEAHQREQERLALARREAERRESDRQEAERLAAAEQAAERARAEEAERLEAEQRALAEEEERLNVKRRREERLEAHRLEVEQREAELRAAEEAEAGLAAVEPVPALDPAAGAVADQLTLAQQAWSDAKERGDRRGARAINERVVELLRPRAEADPDTYGSQLQYALEELSSARLRSGDVWGSRGPAREAKALAKTLSRR